MKRLAAIIPAAGLSSRMGRFKPLLPLGDGTVLSQVVTLFRAVGVEQVVVVTGKRADEVADEARRAGASAVNNLEYAQGMYSSVRAGVGALADTVVAFFVLPADIPLVRCETVTRLIHEFREARPAILYPCYLHERGHPPLIDKRVVPPIMHHGGKGGLRAVLDTFETEAAELAVADFGVSYDLDHPEDYELARRSFGREYPTVAECAVLSSMYAVSDHIVGHCQAVAQVAVALGEALNARRSTDQLNMGLIQGAALTHDIGKGSGHHEAVGAELLHGHGFHAAADIVRQHFDQALAPDKPITESQVVFLADKLVRCHRPVSLEGRYHEKMEMYANEPGAPEAIQGRLSRARVILARFDAEMGVSAEQLAREALA